jgi:hypothetical protein
MPYGFDPAERRRVRELPGTASLCELPVTRGRGPLGAVLAPVSRTPVVRGINLTILRAGFTR